MNEKSLEVLKQYDLNVSRVCRGRGGMLLNTDCGVKLFLECTKQDKFYEREARLTRAVSEKGFELVDTYMTNKNGELVSQDEDGRHFVVKDWYDGRECNVKDTKDICMAVTTLAKLHIVLNSVAPELEEISCRAAEVSVCEPDKKFKNNQQEKTLCETYARHMRELKLAGNYLRNKKKKSAFEQLACRSIDGFYKEAVEAVKKMNSQQFGERFANARETGELCHGSYNYHNILFGSGAVAVTNFDKYKNECQISDLYQFMRKILEKYDWNMHIAYKMIEEYDKVKPIEDTDLALLSAMFSFPEKYWKVINSYFNANKAWIPPKTLEKLEKVVAQNEKRHLFLQTVLA